MRLKRWGTIDGKLIAMAQINIYLMAMEKEDTVNENVKEKLETYQNSKEQYLMQKQDSAT